MKDIKNLKIFLITTLLIISLDIKSIGSLANPLPSPRILELGGIVYDTNNSLNLINANVVFNIDSTDFQNNISILFEGNYTIYNPTNSTTNVSIYAPFSFQMSTEKSDWQLIVNGSSVEFEIVWFYSLDPYLISYFANYTSYVDFFIVFNTSISKEKSQEIYYRFYKNMVNPLYNTDYYSIHYIIATARAWINNITENVEFRVEGTLPNSYTENTEKECIISDIPNGKTYSWEWNNEYINDNYVGINYSGRLLKPEEILFYILLLGGIGIGGIILIIFLIKRKKKE